MGIWTSLKDKIFGKHEDKPANRATTGQVSPPSAQAHPTTPAPAPTAPQPVSEVDVEQRLDSMSGADKLNWRTSIVDLLKLVGIDPSYENRKELAHEMGDSDYSGSAEENITLHKRVMQELAKNGGKVPASLTD